MGNLDIRHCAPGDYGAIVGIYNHYVEYSHATFDLFDEVGWKFGKYWSVAWYAMRIQD